MNDLMDILEKAALEAGRVILEVYSKGAEVMLKADCSPVTEADQKAETVILAHLAQAFPQIPVIAEESVAAGRIPDIGDGPFFLVDPLDGTKEFIARNGDFTVNIALIEKGVPVAGIVYAPVIGLAYTAVRNQAEKLAINDDFAITSRTRIYVRASLAAPVALISRSHNSTETLAFLEREGICDNRTIGSSLKFGLLAEGGADVYPRFSRTMEWDTAAGDAVLRAAGGRVTDTTGAPLAYGKPGFANPFFIAYGG